MAVRNMHAVIITDGEIACEKQFQQSVAGVLDLMVEFLQAIWELGVSKMVLLAFGEVWMQALLHDLGTFTSC